MLRVGATERRFRVWRVWAGSRLRPERSSLLVNLRAGSDRLFVGRGAWGP